LITSPIASLMSRNTAKPARGLGLINKKQNLTIFKFMICYINDKLILF